MEKKNIHCDHRKRVREKYLKFGSESMAEHNILELLLFYGITQKDTNPIAHDLIDRFGDINGVINAPIEELKKVNGIGDNAAILIHLVRDICEQFRQNSESGKVNVSTKDRLFEFLNMKYLGERRETVCMLCVDSSGNVEHCVKVTEGSVNSANIDNRTIVETAIRYNAVNIILVHNHPQGFAVPSTVDIDATRSLVKLLRAISINMVDHIIVAGNECFSMASNKRYSSLFM